MNQEPAKLNTHSVFVADDWLTPNCPDYTGYIEHDIGGQGEGQPDSPPQKHACIALSGHAQEK